MPQQQQLIVGKGSRLLIGLWSPLPTGVKLDAKLLQTHPILRTSSNGILAAGSSLLLRSYQQYTTTHIELNDGSNGTDIRMSYLCLRTCRVIGTALYSRLCCKCGIWYASFSRRRVEARRISQRIEEASLMSASPC